MRLFFLGPRFFGIRPGISLGREDFRQRRSQEAPIQGSFLYVIAGPPGLIKVGVTTDPRARLAALQTGSPYPLKFLALLAMESDGYALEAEIHAALSPWRTVGEWFRVNPVRALIAIRRAADALREPVLAVTLERAEEILVVARSAPPATISHRWARGWLIPVLGGLVTFVLTFRWLLSIH